jgi:hypothetical protein
MDGAQQRAPRIPTSLRALYTLERADFAGTIVDLSRSGARVEAPENRVPETGAQIRLCIAGSRDRQIEVAARVARQTEQGFGAQFIGSTPVELLELLVDLGGSESPWE